MLDIQDKKKYKKILSTAVCGALLTLKKNKATQRLLN